MHRQAFHRASGGEGITIKDIFQDGLAYLASLAFHPFYPLLAAAIAFNLAIAGRLAEVQQKVSEVEHKTGCHAWSMHHYAKADGDYSSLSARMSVVATTLAANKRLNGMAAEILPTFNAHSDLWQKHATKHTWKETGLVAVHINHLTGRLATQRIHIEYNMARVQNQLTALFNLTNQTDMKLRIALAKDSRTLASASKRDSSSMKTLAAVTVTFLPGTFVASLFSMSMFDWTAADSRVLTSKFWIYWAITIPLTLLTIATWLIWTHWQYMLHRTQAQDELLEGEP